MSGCIYPNLHDEKKLDGFRKRYNFIREFVRDKQVLDLGSGSGYGTTFYADATKYTVGLDLKENVDYANNVFSSKKVKFYEHDLRKKLPVNLVKRFDVVIMCEIIEHFHYNDCLKVIYTAYDALKDGGLLIGTTPNMKDKMIEYPDKLSGDHCTLFHKRDLLKILYRFNDIKFHSLIDWALVWTCIKEECDL
jgi:2-polyprenyl-3-methyl-5-hydroxy-6-metoxy-1,4-benzoquinol methylase